ncbi:MAG: hypothetical protein CM15mP23_03360 [Cryomorphaceae bacterium]|nr:MAG: hypothetical protein CM15mP23_03360 [Cryomorphaceae bacterium]
MIFSRKEVFDNKIPDYILGIYYFIDENNHILYIGKSKNIKKRIQQHIKNGRKRLINKFSKLKLKIFRTELEALLYESQEIKEYLPVFNRRLRKIKSSVGIFNKKNKFGHSYFYIKKSAEDSIIDFRTKKHALKFIDKMSKKFNLCPKLNGLDNSSKFCFQFHLKSCQGACNNLEKPLSYNSRFQESLSEIYCLPKNCELVFHDNKFSTFVNIKNSIITSFGVKNHSFFKINHPSHDELKIINSYQKILVPETILV